MFEIKVMPESFKLKGGTLQRPEGGSDRAELVSVRNSFAAFQLLIESDEPYSINTGRSLYISQNNNAAVYRVEADSPFRTDLFIESMHTAEYLTPYADGLLPGDHADFDGVPSVIWVEAEIPADAVPGLYDFTVRVFRSRMLGAEEPVCAIPGRIEVLRYVLPDVRSRKLHLDLWQHSSNIARQHETPLWSEAHFSVLEPYIKSLGELGQKAVTVIAGETPWCGQGCGRERRVRANMYEYSMIPVRRGADGAFSYDFSIMQRYIDLCAKYGIDREISVYGLCNIWENGAFKKPAPDHPDAVRLRYYDEASGRYAFMTRGRDIDDYIRALERYFIETKQIGLVRIAADEPADIGAYRRSVEHIRSVAPSFRFKAAINHAAFIGEFGAVIDDFVPYIEGLSAEYERICEYKRTMPGKRFLWYVCCGPESPNTFIRSPLTESYAIGVLTSFAGMDGFLRWSYTDWTDDPRTEINYPAFPAGDIALVYPARNGKPMLTLRYKALRRGFELYELLEALKEKGLTGALEEAYDCVLRHRDIRLSANGGMFSAEYADYVQLMRIAAEALAGADRLG